MSESITSTGPRGPIAKRSSHAAGASQTSSLAETSKRLNSMRGLRFSPDSQSEMPPAPDSLSIRVTLVGGTARVESVEPDKVQPVHNLDVAEKGDLPNVSPGHGPLGNIIMGPAVKFAAGLFLAHAAPLLKEERDARGTALVADRADPVGLHRPGTRPAFSSQNDPADAG